MDTAIYPVQDDEEEEEKRSWMIDQTQNMENEAWLVEQIKNNNKIMIVSDGSFHPDYKVGTSAWVITSESNHNTRIHGDNIIPGEIYLQCSHWSELWRYDWSNSTHYNDM